MEPMARDKVRICRSRGGVRLETLLSVLAVGLLVFLALPVYNSLKDCGWACCPAAGDGNATNEGAEVNGSVSNVPASVAEDNATGSVAPEEDGNGT